MATLTGYLFNDINGNGIRNSGEELPSPGAFTIFVDYNGDSLLTTGEPFALSTDATAFNSDGSYSITGIQTGTYAVRIIVPTADPAWQVTRPSSPAGNPFYPVTFNENTLVGLINFEDAPARGLTDDENPATRDGAFADDQIYWNDLGFNFWLDQNNNFISDAIDFSDPTRSIYLEKVGDNGTRGLQQDQAFINDLITGNFDINRNTNINTYDRANSPADFGNYFLRGGGLYTNTTIPKLLIELKDPTAGMAGDIIDIDTTWAEHLAGRSEQWLVRAFDATQTEVDISPTDATRNGILSPRGESVWDKSTGVWQVNPNSLDGKAWRFEFQLNEAIVKWVRIEYVGNKDAATTGVAFDNFEAYTVRETSADFGVYQPPEPTRFLIGDYVWDDANRNGIQDLGENGVINVRVELLDASGNPVLDGTGSPIFTFTDLDGLYNFSVIDGQYQLRFELPSNYDGFTTKNATGSTILNDSNVNASGITGVFAVSETDPSNYQLSFDAGLVIEEGGVLQGLTIGAWKNFYANRNKGGNNPAKYQATWGVLAPTYTPTTPYETAFELVGHQSSGDVLTNFFTPTTYNQIARFDGDSSSISLIDALNARGNTQFQNFLRQSTAGLLNAAHPDINYAYSVGEVKGYAQSVFVDPLTLTSSEINALATLLDQANNAGNVQF